MTTKHSEFLQVKNVRFVNKRQSCQTVYSLLKWNQSIYEQFAYKFFIVRACAHTQKWFLFFLCLDKVVFLARSRYFDNAKTLSFLIHLSNWFYSFSTRKTILCLNFLRRNKKDTMNKKTNKKIAKASMELTRREQKKLPSEVTIRNNEISFAPWPKLLSKFDSDFISANWCRFPSLLFLLCLSFNGKTQLLCVVSVTCVNPI